MPENNLQRQIKVKVQEDTDQRLASFREQRRKLKVQSESQKKAGRKELLGGEASNTGSSFMDSSANLSIVLALGLTLALINDFSDLVLWQKVSLISQTIDITTLILVLFMVIFASRAYFFSVFLILFIFLFEIMPVIGVLPLWTAGIAAWYFINRKSKK
jgi:hypothetical protein